RNALNASRGVEQHALDECGVEDSTDAALVRASETARQLSLAVSEIDETERKLGETIAELGERLKERQKQLNEAEEHLTKEEKEWKPADELWERLRERATTNGLLSVAISSRLLEVGSGSVNL